MALVMGANGALGSSIATHLKSKGHEVIGVDVTSPPDPTPLDAFVQLDMNHTNSSSMEELSRVLKDSVAELFDPEDEEAPLLDAIICANGGFAMDELGNNAHVHDQMMKVNYYPTLAAAELCKDYMTDEDGLFVAFGAVAACINPVDARNMCGISAYTQSKNAVHHLIYSMGLLTGKKRLSQKKTTDDFKIQSLNVHRYLNELSVVGILPAMLDTPANRISMGMEDGDDSWTNVEDIAKEIGTWMDVPDLRPHSGALIKVITENGQTDFILHR